jgi:pyruvate formate lyase activating enzyme
MKKARFYEKNPDGSTLTCRLCHHNCRITTGKRGICMVRENIDGELYSMVYGRLVSASADPVEKKPLFHFMPGTKTFSISTTGCNFRCLHCQNYHISQYPLLHHGETGGQYIEPETVVRNALDTGCRSISYTYVEPTIFYEYAFDTGVLAKEAGLKNIFVSNGYMQPGVTRELATFLDGINIDLKAFTDSFYRKTCGASLQPILDNIRLFHELGVWVEVTTLVIPGLNDSPGELRETARFICGIDRKIPWHVTGFHPVYKMSDRQPTDSATLKMARDIGMEEGLDFVYAGNRPGSKGENTLCPGCGYEVITRYGFSIVDYRLKNGKCPECGERIDGLWG